MKQSNRKKVKPQKEVTIEKEIESKDNIKLNIEKKDVILGSYDWVVEYLKDTKVIIENSFCTIKTKDKEVCICGVDDNVIFYHEHANRKDGFWYTKAWSTKEGDMSIFRFPLTPRATKYCEDFIQKCLTAFKEIWINA